MSIRDIAAAALAEQQEAQRTARDARDAERIRASAQECRQWFASIGVPSNDLDVEGQTSGLISRATFVLEGMRGDWAANAIKAPRAEMDRPGARFLGRRRIAGRPGMGPQAWFSGYFHDLPTLAKAIAARDQARESPLYDWEEG